MELALRMRSSCYLRENYHSSVVAVNRCSKLKILPKIVLKDWVFLENSPIVFVHPAKTGGANINQLAKALNKEYGIQSLKAISSCSASYFKNDIDITTKGCLKGVTRLKQLGKNRLEKIDIVVGQFPLPESEYFGKEINAIATIRHPLDRSISLANYLYQRKVITESDVEMLLLETEVDNLQTRFLAGENYMDGDCVEEIFAKAKENIDNNFKVVVPTEEVETLISMIGSYFNLTNIAYAKSNVTGRKIVSKNDTELCEKIIARNAYDIELYNYVQTHWQKWKEQHIEAFLDNASNDKEYFVLGPDLYYKDKVNYMNLEQVLSHSEQMTGLIEGNQRFV
jgi:hypothetical protein